MGRQKKDLGITGASYPREGTKPKVQPCGPVPNTAAQGGRSSEAPLSEGLLGTFDQAQLSPQKPTALISSPLLMIFPISFPSPTRTPGFARPPLHRGVCFQPCQGCPGGAQGPGQDAPWPCSLLDPRWLLVPALGLDCTQWDTRAVQQPDIKGALMGD